MGLIWVERTRFAAQMCASIDDAAYWLPSPHARRTGVTIHAAELASVLNLAFKRVPTPSLAHAPWSLSR